MDGAWRRRTFYQDISGNLTMAATDSSTTLVTVKNTSHTLFIQRVVVYITTDAAQSWAFVDSNGTPLADCKVTTSPGVDTRWDFDFGDDGIPCTSGKNFVLTASGAGLAGRIVWYGYAKLNNATAVASI